MYYCKTKQETFNINQQDAFLNTLINGFTGAEAVKDLIQSHWQYGSNVHQWTLPNGHVSKVLVTETVTTNIEVDELDHTRFAYRFKSNQPSDKNTSLVANIVQSIDAYIADQMVLRANKLGFQLAHIFDGFTFHPNYANHVCQNYREILAEIADMPLLSNILSEITGKKILVNKYSNDLSKDILQSEYALS